MAGARSATDTNEPPGRRGDGLSGRSLVVPWIDSAIERTVIGTMGLPYGRTWAFVEHANVSALAPTFVMPGWVTAPAQR